MSDNAVNNLIPFPITISESSGFSEETSALKYLSKDESDGMIINDVSYLVETLLEELVEVANEGTKGNYDKYNAKPVQIETYEEVKTFISKFPFRELPFKPDVLIEPDGSLELDWENSEIDCSFAISFSGSGKLYYAGMFLDGANTSGVENFDGIWIPQELTSYVRRVYKQED